MKGVLFLSRLAFLREQGGSALEQVLAELSPADASVLRGPVLRDAWYPLDLHHRVGDAIASMFAQHDREDVLVHVGRASADVILAGADGRYTKRGAPEFFLQNVPQLHRGLHTVGHREYQRVSSNTGVIRTFNAGRVATRDDCWTVIGWLQRGLELSGVETVLVAETSCSADGAWCCEYRCEWGRAAGKLHR